MAQGRQIGLMAALVALGVALGGAGVYLLVSRREPPASPPAPAPVVATPAPAETTEPVSEPSPAAGTEPSPETPVVASAKAPAKAPARPERSAKADAGAAAPRPVTKAPAPAVATRSFASSMPSATGPLVKGNVPGFAGAKSEVHRAPKVPGTLEFETDPVAPVPGQPYTVRVFLRNQGKKTIKLLTVVMTATQDDAHSGGVVPLPVKEIKEGQRVMVAERRETWPAPPPRSFVLQAMVKSKDDDTYSRTLALK